MLPTAPQVTGQRDKIERWQREAEGARRRRCYRRYAIARNRALCRQRMTGVRGPCLPKATLTSIRVHPYGRSPGACSQRGVGLQADCNARCQATLRI